MFKNTDLALPVFASTVNYLCAGFLLNSKSVTEIIKRISGKNQQIISILFHVILLVVFLFSVQYANGQDVAKYKIKFAILEKVRLGKTVWGEKSRRIKAILIFSKTMIEIKPVKKKYASYTVKLEFNKIKLATYFEGEDSESANPLFVVLSKPIKIFKNPYKFQRIILDTYGYLYPSELQFKSSKKNYPKIMEDFKKHGTPIKQNLL